jgi:hypothetical protein
MIETRKDKGRASKIRATCMSVIPARAYDSPDLSQTSEAENYPALLGAKITGGAHDGLRKEPAVMMCSQLEVLGTEAEQLLAEQASLRQKLDQLLQGSGPQTGLYRGESRDEFPLFVQRLRKVLTRSPRTILR